MADFDPDAYLAGTDTGGFDPDAYLAGGAKESFLQKIGGGIGKAITEVAPYIPFSRGIGKAADFALGGIIREPTASKFAESVGRRFPESKTAQIGAAALGTIGQVAAPIDFILPVVSKLRFLIKAPQAVKATELAKIASETKPEVLKAAQEALSSDELLALTADFPKPLGTGKLVEINEQNRINQLFQKIKEQSAELARQEIPKKQGLLVPPPKPFTLQAGMSPQEQAALEAFRAKLPQARPPIVAAEAPAVPLARVLPAAPIPPTEAFAGNIRLSKYSPEAQKGILAANKLTGVAERTPSTIAEMRIAGATPEAQALFDTVAKGKSGELAGKTQLVRETLEKEASVFAEQADVAIKAGGDELDNLITSSPVFKTEEQISRIAQASGQTLGVFRQNTTSQLTKGTIATLEKIKKQLRATKSPFAQKKIETIEKIQKALDKKQLELAKLPAAFREAMEVTDKIYTLWINSILSNPLTHLRNIGGNTLFMVSKPVEKIIAASVDNALYLFTGKAPEHTFKEAGEMIKAGVKYMVGKGEKLPFDVRKAGFGKFDRPMKEIQGMVGKITGAPTKALEWEDNIFKNMAAQMEYAALKSKGVMGDELTKRVMDEAAYRTYQDEAGKIVEWIMEGRDKVPGFRWVIPFVRTPAKLLARGLERTPLGAFKIAGKVAKGAYKEVGGQAALASDIGNTILGSAASAMLAMHYGKGNISGAWPTDRREAERWKAEGKKPWSYRTKDGWIALDRIEPFGAVVKTTISILDTFKNMEDESKDKVAMAAAANLGKELVRMSAFNGFQNFAQSISDPARFAPKTTASIVSGFVPGASKFAVDYIPGLKDPLMRQKEGIAEMAMGRTPFLSERLKPQLDIWGEPIGKEAFFSAVSRARDSKELDLLKQLDLPVPNYPDKKFGYKFTNDEKFAIQQKAGPIIKSFLSQYVGREILDTKKGAAEITAGIKDINDAVSQLEVLKIPFTPNRQQADILSTVINSHVYKKYTPEQRKERLNRIIFTTPK